MAGFVVFLMLGAIISAWYDNRERLLEEQKEKTRQAEQARQTEQDEKARQVEQAQRQAEKAKLKAEADKLSIHCGELEDKYNANPLKNRPYRAEVSEAELKERDAEYSAKYDCWKQYEALRNEIDPEGAYCREHAQEWRSDEAFLTTGLSGRNVFRSMRGEAELTQEQDDRVMASSEVQATLKEHEELGKRCGWGH
jgi:membrane protein involved in colicin uptake